MGILLAAVLILSLIEILGRNLGWHPWDMGANQRAVYGFTFYLGLYGAVLASRQGKHISIDVASSYLSPREITRGYSPDVGCCNRLRRTRHLGLHLHHSSDPTRSILGSQSDSGCNKPAVVCRIVERSNMAMANGSRIWINEYTLFGGCF